LFPLIMTGLWLISTGLLLSPAVFSQTETAAIQLQDDTRLAGKIVALIERNQWEPANALLDQQAATDDQTLQSLRLILDEHRTLEKTRTDKQQELFNERYQMLSGVFERIIDNDPNLNYQGVYRQLQNVWKDASKAQQQDIAAQPAFGRLMDRARQTTRDYYDHGQWSDAYSRGAWWLTVFEPDDPDTRQWDKKLSEVNAILEFLRNSPCEDKKQRYEPILPSTVEKIFSILEDHYVKSPNYLRMADGMMDRAIILGDVLSTASDDLVLQIDPNAVPLWTEQIRLWTAKMDAVEDLNYRDFREQMDVLTALNEATLQLPEGFLLSMLTDAALAELDSYTDMVWPYAVSDFDKAMTGQFGGIGVQIRKENGGLRVLSLIPDTPAMEAGLQAEALIVAVDGENTADMSATCAVRKISGPIGTPVTLTIRYPGIDADELITMIRDKIVVPAVEGSRQARIEKADVETDDDPNAIIPETAMDTLPSPEGNWDYFLDAEARIGYLRLKTFTEQSVPEVTAALDEMESRGLAGLILDLRGNGGGLLTAAVDIADLFIDQGILLHSRGRRGAFGIWPATEADNKRTYPLVVLIDGASASASEIVAGVLDSPVNERAILVGQRTYGKGSVQEVVNLGSASGKLKFTTAFYYLPDGSPVKNRDRHLSNGVDDWGIEPDIEVPIYDFERLQMRRINTRRTRISHTVRQEGSQTDILDQMLAVDPQLATALLVVKAQVALAAAE